MSITQAVTNSKGPSSLGSRLNVHYITNRKSVLKVPCGYHLPPQKKEKKSVSACTLSILSSKQEKIK